MARARDYMTRQVVALTPDMDVHAALAILLDHRISGAPVVGARGELVGILTERDLISAVFRASYHQDHGGLVRDHMSRELVTVDADAELVEVAELFLKSRHRRFPVLEGAQLVGLLARRDVLRAIQELR